MIVVGLRFGDGIFTVTLIASSLSEVDSQSMHEKKIRESYLKPNLIIHLQFCATFHAHTSHDKSFLVFEGLFDMKCV